MDDVDVPTYENTEGDAESSSTPTRRIRRCADCNKRLGSTVGRCFECGGEQPSTSREDRLADAVEWKIRLGVDPQLIERAHDTEDEA